MTPDSLSPSRTTSFRELIDRPIFVVSTPRSGSTLLFETLAGAPGLFTTGEESHRRIESIGDLHPRNRGWTSNRLVAEEATSAMVGALADNFYPYLTDRSGAPPAGPVRMLEKTPKNALRVPFFAEAWPDAIFVYLYREPRQTLASMIEAWSTGRFRTYPGLPGWIGQQWSLLLVPGWRDLIGCSLPEVVAAQWATTTDILVGDLEALPQERVRTLDYDSFIADPQGTMERLTASLGLDWDLHLGATLPPSRFTTSRPARDKWMRLAPVIADLLPTVEQADLRAKRFLERFV